jgi:CRISPR/Cas system-associated endoribonuclease Cas2
MNIKYSAHAVDRMLQRKITTTQIERILNDPDGMIHQSKDKIIFYKILKERKDNALAVVTVLKSIDIYEVITVMINFEVNK